MMDAHGEVDTEHLSSTVEASFRGHSRQQMTGAVRTKDRADRATSEQVLDPRTIQVAAIWHAPLHCLEVPKHQQSACWIFTESLSAMGLLSVESHSALHVKQMPAREQWIKIYRWPSHDRYHAIAYLHPLLKQLPLT